MYSVRSMISIAVFDLALFRTQAQGVNRDRRDAEEHTKPLRRRSQKERGMMPIMNNSLQAGAQTGSSHKSLGTRLSIILFEHCQAHWCMGHGEMKEGGSSYIYTLHTVHFHTSSLLGTYMSTPNEIHPFSGHHKVIMIGRSRLLPITLYFNTVHRIHFKHKLFCSRLAIENGLSALQDYNCSLYIPISAKIVYIKRASCHYCGFTLTIATQCQRYSDWCQDGYSDRGILC